MANGPKSLNTVFSLAAGLELSLKKTTEKVAMLWYEKVSENHELILSTDQGQVFG